MTAVDRHIDVTAANGPLCLPRDEMAFRDRYQMLLLDQKITTVFRPGNRRWPNWRGYIVGETVNARVIERPGCDALNIPPQFNAVRVPIQIRDLSVKSIQALDWDDFAGSSADVFDQESLMRHLLEIYGNPIRACDSLVTRIRFEYVTCGCVT